MSDGRLILTRRSRKRGFGALKLVVGVIRPERLEAVKEALGEAKVFRLTVSDVQGLSPEEAPAPSSAAAAYAGAAAAATRPTRKVKLEIAVNESVVEPTVRAIARAARLDGGRPGDGKVLVLPLEECVRIRTGERGPEAI
jgi:nitrogen regulatory protein P-II 2